MTEIGMIRQVGRSMFLGGNYDPIPEGWGPCIPKIFGTSYMCTHTV